ncbi:DUF1380 family protein [Salmonella enterica]|nr:DUF1380 domain-containing protein [Salmonella enterica]EGL7938265.1 DUF1380 domain-containing protein [Salmonella enterica]EHQ8094941.1 DUF1380 family protein [Salmonella enterica]EHU8016141.1 DUF1380 family protein [Salmonella enterica]EIB7527301.1 DUF1380 family protein [Salmonella enterica]
MYGTVSEICIALLKQYESNKKIAVITWTPEDVREAGAEYSPTDDDVSYVLRVIGKAGSAGLWRYGLGLEFVADELSKIAAARTSRQIAVPEDALRILLPLMEAGMNIPRYQTPDTAAGELAALDTLKNLLAVPFTLRPAE